LPLVHHFIPETDCHLLVWKVAESATFFKDNLGKKNYELPEYLSISHPAKQLEWLASRFLAKHLAEMLHISYAGLVKDEHNKPFLHQTTQHVSLSHSKYNVAAAIHIHKPVGIDLEVVSPRLRIIEHKFLTETERLHAGGQLSNLTVYWSAKEALYKLWGKRGLHFQQQILVHPFDSDTGHTTGQILTETATIDAQIFFYQIGNEYVTLAV
jgi:4'-phosphopantetheinyl transferase